MNLKDNIMAMRHCLKCGFILDTKPGLLEKNGVCQACINHENKKDIDYAKNIEIILNMIKSTPKTCKYDCVIGVSGGKDSTSIVKRICDFNLTPLLVTVCDEFTSTQAGMHNRKNICNAFHVDHIFFRHNPEEFLYHTRKDFEEELNPLKWFESRLYQVPCEIAQAFNIKYVFMGEDSSFEYGTSEELHLFHPTLTTENLKVIFSGSLFPYSIMDSYNTAKEYGFRGLDYYNEWHRNGLEQLDTITQIDSLGYLIHIYLKFIKFGFQRVSDIASRFVRDGLLTKEQAELYIKENDWRIDRQAKLDFCKTIKITEEYFDQVIDKHANKDLLYKDINGNWKLKE